MGGKLPRFSVIVDVPELDSAVLISRNKLSVVLPAQELRAGLHGHLSECFAFAVPQLVSIQTYNDLSVATQRCDEVSFTIPTSGVDNFTVILHGLS